MVVGGLAVRWEREGVYIDSSLNLHDPALKPAFIEAVNNMVHLARAIHRQGVFKSCLFNARQTLHLERASPEEAFHCQPEMAINYEVSAVPEQLVDGALGRQLQLPRDRLDRVDHLEERERALAEAAGAAAQVAALQKELERERWLGLG